MFLLPRFKDTRVLLNIKNVRELYKINWGGFNYLFTLRQRRMASTMSSDKVHLLRSRLLRVILWRKPLQKETMLAA